MNLTYIIGLVGAFAVFLFGCVSKVVIEPAFEITIDFGQLINLMKAAAICRGCLEL